MKYSKPKNAMTLWRKEGRHHLGDDPNPGDIVIFKGRNSTAITLDGAEHFAEVSNREFKWTYEIEAPAGTRGAYVSHLSKNERIRLEMEYLLAKDTEMEIVEFNDKKHYAKLRILPRGANKAMTTLKHAYYRLRRRIHYVQLEC